MGRRINEVVVDCADPARLAGFWARLLGAPTDVGDAGWATVAGEPARRAVHRVPEGTPPPKNRLHLDVEDADLLGAVAALGATRLGEVVRDGAGGFVVVAEWSFN